MKVFPDEADVIIALRQGSEQAFEKIYQAYSPRLFGRLMKLVKSEAYAKEILQDVFFEGMGIPCFYRSGKIISILPFSNRGE